MSIYRHNIWGLRAPSGNRYIKVTAEDGRTSAPIPLGMFAGNGHEALIRLKHEGLPIIGTDDCRALIQKVAQNEDFELAVVAEKVGWNSHNLFVLPDGEVIAPSNAGPIQVALPIFVPETETAGSLSDWKRLVARPMEGQAILQFSTMFMFAAPLLALTPRADNFGFELVGRGGRGKSTLQRIVTSVAGRTGPGADGHYLSYFDTTINALEDAMVSHSDLPLLLEEANLFAQAETARALASKFKAVAFKLGSGTLKSRWGTPAGRATRLIYLSSSNEPLASIIGENSSTAEAAADRLITIPVPPRDSGVLDAVPDDAPDAGTFMDNLLAAASLNYGHPLREFLRRLVEDRATDEAQLKARISEWMAVFRNRSAHVAVNRRVIDAFGLVYAAGKLATAYRVLPRQFLCGPSTLACLHLHRDRRSAGLSFSERLRAIVPDAANLGRGRVPSLTERQFDAGLFVRHGGRGKEVLITEPRITHYFPDWVNIRNREEVSRLLNSEEGRKMIRRKISAGHPKVRVFSFTLRDEDEEP